MICICDNYGKAYDVMFNSKKNQRLICDSKSKYNEMKHLMLYDSNIAVTNSVNHLGFCLSSDNSFDDPINRAIMDTWRTNSLLSKC